MKKFVILMAVMLLASCLFACGGRKPSTSSKKPQASVSTSQSEVISNASSSEQASSSNSSGSSETTKFDITIQNIEGGTISSNKASASEGETISLTVECNQYYTLKSLFVNGQEITGNSFTMPSQNVVITVEYSYTAHWSPQG